MAERIRITGESEQGFELEVTDEASGTVSNGHGVPMKSGDPIREGDELIFVDTTNENKDGYLIKHRVRHDGPAKVTSNAYRKGWDAIFGGKQGSAAQN